MHDFNITRVVEGDLVEAQIDALATLLDTCFPNTFSGRIYFKQRPHFRLLAERDAYVCGQVGVDDRMMRLGQDPIRVFGLIDLCVDPGCRGNGIGSSLLNRAEELARRARADFLILFADESRLYDRNGFVRVGNSCTWLAIDEHESLGMQTDGMAHCLMVKSLGMKVWSHEPLDLLGYLY